MTPELRQYVIRREGGACIVALLKAAGRIRREVDDTPCRDRWGGLAVPGDERALTAAHVRDRGRGGRTGKRPPSTPRHLAACCWGHHVPSPVVDRPEVRDEVDRYLEGKEGPEAADGRPWEAISRVRGARDEP